MKPLVSAFTAWSCVVVSCFAIVILSVLGSLFQRGHHTVMGQTGDPKDGAAVASSIFISVGVYAAFLAFCSLQARYLHIRAVRKRQISLR